MESLWRKETGSLGSKPGSFCSERENWDKTDSRWDVIVIGAGMAGLLIAYFLQEQGKKVLVLEAKTIASGQTERTTAKITSQHDLKYSKLIKTVGVEKARLYARANEAAIKEYEKLINSRGIDCQFEKTEAYLYSTQEETSLREEAEAASLLGIDAFFTTETELPFPAKAAVGFRNQAQFAPLEFAKEIAGELEILEHTKVTGIKGNRVITDGAEFIADKIVVATHYPIVNVPGFYFLRQHQERSYVLALSGCNRIKGMYIGIDQDGLSFRQAGEYLLLGGSSHRTGQNKRGGAYEILAQAAKELFPESKEEMRWSAQDCMPHDGIPFIGRYSSSTPDLYVATGFQKWGMTTSMIAALLIRDEICNGSNPYEGLFSPQRMNFKAAIGNFMIDLGTSIKGLSKGLLGLVSPKVKRCPHMGCALEWNPDEQKWECPCHGSRFQADGKLLDNPAKKDLR